MYGGLLIGRSVNASPRDLSSRSRLFEGSTPRSQSASRSIGARNHPRLQDESELTKRSSEGAYIDGPRQRVLALGQESLDQESANGLTGQLTFDAVEGMVDLVRSSGR